MCDNIISSIEYNENNKYNINNLESLSNKIYNTIENYNKLNSIEDILKKFNYLIFQTSFSCKYLYLDELTGKKYRKEELYGSDNDGDNDSLNSYITENSDDTNFDKLKNRKIKKKKN